MVRQLKARRASGANLANGFEAHAERCARLAKSAAVVALAALTVASGLALPSAAHALTTEYEIEGEWSAGTPNPVTTGSELTSVWRYNINDADPAPENPPQDNVTITFAAQNATFTEVPLVCLTTGVTPVSEIIDNKSTLVCNLGTRDHGTAELLLTGMKAAGTTGDTISMSASIGEPGVNEASATLPELDVANVFAMDMKFDAGRPSSASAGGVTQQMSFPWSLRHAPGSTDGPNSVSYELTFSGTNGEPIVPQSNPCSVQDRANPGYPYSGNGFAAEQTAPFPGTCTLTQISPNVFDLTLTGIDYSSALSPTEDTGGTSLPTDWNVVAAGLINVEFSFVDGTTISYTASAPTYTSMLGATSIDDPSNNSNARVATRGAWTGGWRLNFQDPPVQGTTWTDTFRTLPGQPALAASGVRPPEGSETETQVCTVLDTKYTTFVSSAAGTISDGVVTPFSGVIYEYFVGTGTGGMVNPDSPAYDPNDFRCDGSTGTAWQSNLPADLSQVKAIRATYPASANIPDDVAKLYTYTQIKPDAPIGQDVWTWTSYRVNQNGNWFNPHRTLDVADVPPPGTLTPDSRYPYAAAGRDVLRIIAGQPQIDKQIDQPVTMPGATVNFTLTYRVEAPVDSTVDDVAITDVLPNGLTYVPGSATLAPSSVSGQTVEWLIDGVQTNTDYTILLSATVDGGADPGDIFTNTASIQLADVSDSDTANTRIRDGGYTFLTKTADAQQVPHVDGTADGGWTVRLTSADTSEQTYTDTIDVLPYNGDGRGTSFSGSYELSGAVTGAPGATVYYTTADPATLNDDPADPSNGSAGDPTGNTVGWTTTYAADATGVRVIGPSLAAGAAQEFDIDITTTGATFEDMYVNRAEARASHTELTMRTSAWFEIAAANSVMIKKYVQDADGQWHDAQNVDDYPSFYNGDTVTYRLVVTNTGDQTITNLQLADDKVDLAALDPLPAGLDAGAVIPTLEPGEVNAVTIEYDVALAGYAAGDNLVNTACATPEDTSIDASCDPAGLTILPSSLAWQKIAAGTNVEYLSGAEWELVLVDANQDPAGTVLSVTDCVEAQSADCVGSDQDPAAGSFLVADLPDGEYRLTETRAPAGYVLDGQPRYITVQGLTELPLPIENEQAVVPVIPLTGGMGTLWIFVGGALAAALAALLIVVRRVKTRGDASSSERRTA